MKHNLIHAIRGLRKSILYSALTISGLTIGLTVFLIAAIFVYHEYTVDHCYSEYQNIYRLYNADNNECIIDIKLADVLKEQFTEIKANAPVDRIENEMILKGNANNIIAKGGISTTNDFFNVFDIKVVSKVTEKPFSETMSVILTRSIARKLFGEDNPLGQEVNIDNMFNVKVTAIIDDFPENSSLKADFLINAECEELRFWMICNSGDCYNPSVHYVLLNNDIQKDRFIEHINTELPKHQSRVKNFSLQPLTDIYLSENLGGNANQRGNTSFIRVIMLIACIVLLLAVFNYLNFRLSIQYGQVKEISIKKINGAGNLQLIAYFIFESFLVLSVALLLAIIMVNALSGYASNLLDTQIAPNIILKPVIILAMIIILGLILLLNSIIPTFASLKLNVIYGLNKKLKAGSKFNLKSVLTTLQFAASITLLIAVFTILKQLNFMENSNLGYDHKNLLKLKIPFEFNQRDALQQKINSLSFVQSSAYSMGNPGEVNLGMGNGLDDNLFNIKCLSVDSNFINTMGMQLVQGRLFLSGDKGKACIFNEAAIKKFEWTNIQNKRFMNGREGGYEVVGVIKDFNFESFHSKIAPACLILESQEPTTLSIRVSTGNTTQQINQIKKIWNSVAPNELFTYDFYDTFFNNLYKKEQQLAQSISVLAVIAILLTILGIFGQVVHICIQKTKEIGIRKVNGAQEIEIIGLLSENFLKMIFIAILIACPIGYYIMNIWLENFAYKANLSWWIFALSGIIALGIALLTVSFQSYKTATRNPVESLRYE